ncbi:uncharacterized protein LOC141598929 isoform X1 [Silene latifolia]|uniref:uncharacterized protein LOC141598929 isoform X1 n=1 Tax=Silene latifolia TaxID=37657 RepID=UPI003D774054
MVDLEVETRDGVSGAKKRFLGVTKERNRWVARVRNPMLRADVRLGRYRTPEEAALAVQKKKAEFEEMLKGEDLLSMGTCRGYFKGKKLPTGVSWDNGRYRVQIRHPKLKSSVSGGSYKTCEEAAIAADRKREELREMYGGKLRVIPDNEDDGEVFKKAECLVVSKSGCSEEQTGDIKVPPGVRRMKSGKWGVRIKKPYSKARISLGTYDTLEEAISTLNKKKAEFDAKLKKPAFDCAEFRLGSEANETSLLDAHNLENFALCDKPSYDCGIVDIPANLRDGLVDRSPTSVFDPENLNNAPDSDKSSESGFDRAVSLGIINEYGQLMGKYSELDKYMGLSS